MHICPGCPLTQAFLSPLLAWGLEALSSANMYDHFLLSPIPQDASNLAAALALTLPDRLFLPLGCPVFLSRLVSLSVWSVEKWKESPFHP